MQKQQPEPSREGYIPLNRKFFEHPFWKEKRIFSYAEAWIDLIRLARFDHTLGKTLCQNQLIEFERGEFVTSYRGLAELWRWSKSKVSNFIKVLENENMIIRRTPPGTPQTIIRIKNYDLYNNTHKTQTRQEKDITNKEKKEKEREQPTHPEYKKFLEWMQQETPYCANTGNFSQQITEKQFFDLKQQYTGKQISHILLSIENRKDLRKKYNNLYLTTLKWLKKEYGTK